MTVPIRRWIVRGLASLGVVALSCVLLAIGLVVAVSMRTDPSERGRRFEIGWISDRLSDAGFIVSPPEPDRVSARLRQVVSGDCIHIRRADEAATYCVLNCRDDSVCRATWSHGSQLGESYMEVHREDTVLIQRDMRPVGYSPSRDVIFAP